MSSTNMNNTADHIHFPTPLIVQGLGAATEPQLFSDHFLHFINSTLLFGVAMTYVFSLTNCGSRRPLGMPVRDYLDYIN